MTPYLIVENFRKACASLLTRATTSNKQQAFQDSVLGSIAIECEI